MTSTQSFIVSGCFWACNCVLACNGQDILATSFAGFSNKTIPIFSVKFNEEFNMKLLGGIILLCMIAKHWSI